MSLKGRVGYVGIPGCYTEEAAHVYFKHLAGGLIIPNIKYQSCKFYSSLFDSLDTGYLDYIIAPLENSLVGPVNEVYNWLNKKPYLKIVGEINYKINHCLAAPKGADISDIESVISHPVALDQCIEELSFMGVQKILERDTAQAAKRVLRENKLDQAAICSEAAAKIYELNILEKFDKIKNYTRMIVLSNVPKVFASPGSIKKTSVSVMLQNDDTPGALCDFLKILKDKKINIIKIESRPTPEGNKFFLDIEGHVDIAEDVLSLIKEYTLLGNYYSI